jgi:hypothetical protein
VYFTVASVNQWILFSYFWVLVPFVLSSSLFWFSLLIFVDKQWPYEAAAVAFESIPRTLAQNCGVNVIRTMTALQGKVRIVC